MALTIQRIGRFLRSIFVPATSIFVFSCLLTFIFVLYQPTAGPGEIQRLGWQSWDIISDVLTSTTDVDLPTTPGGGEEHHDQPPSSRPPADVPPGADWWDVPEPDVKIDYASLPLDVWDPLMPHDTGFSEIEITQCWIDPFLASFATSDLCAPSSTKEQDALKGKWVLVARNLNVQGFSFLNVYYRRTRRLDVPLITEIRILPKDQSPDNADATAPDGRKIWTKVSRTVSPRGENLYLWYKAEKPLSDISPQEKRDQLITEIDILYGDDDPWYGFQKLERPVTPTSESAKLEAVWITIRKGVKPPPPAKPLHFSRDGNFRILQVADLHYSVSAGVCRDTVINPCTHSDNLTNSLISRVIDVEKPDLIVFTGDQLNGQGTAWDAKSVMAKFSKIVTEKGVPWAAIFGNHDDEDGEMRESQMKYMQALPYSLVQSGPKDIHGVGNYVVKVHSADPSKTQLLTLYFLDSGSYIKSWYGFGGLVHSSEYDYIHQDQIDWFLEESAQILPIERPFRPDGASDLGDLWKRQDQITPETRRLAKPNALMFFHIPLQETFLPADRHPDTARPLDTGLSGLEGHGASLKNDGFFDKGIMKALESDHSGTSQAHEVKVIGNGHNHITENCRRVKGVWFCFGGGSSYSGYSKVGFDRRFRVYDVNDYGETIRTWQRTEHLEIHNTLILSGKGSPPPYQG